MNHDPRKHGLSKSYGFTLIELLVSIAIISLLSSVVLAAVNTARAKARDGARRALLAQFNKAVLMYENDKGTLPPGVGWLSTANGAAYSAFIAKLVPEYLSATPTDQHITANDYFFYLRKDEPSSTKSCFTMGDATKYSFYVRLESPTPADTATFVDSFDTCVKTNFTVNTRIGN